MTYDPKRQLDSEPEPTELIEYAGPVYALIFITGALFGAYLAVSTWRPQWLT